MAGNHINNRRSPNANERGATMVSVLLLTVSLMTLAMLGIRSANRSLDQANALVARERAVSAAQAAVHLGAAQLREAIENSGNAQVVLDAALVGYNPPNDATICASLYEDCIPGGNGLATVTGQKNRGLTGMSDCAGRPCMRQGAIVRMPNAEGVDTNWVDIPLRALLDEADPEVRVSLWIRNNSADALAANGPGWVQDEDGRVVLTAMATLRNTTVAVSQEFRLIPGTSAQAWNMSSPDVGYGGGHNNDNSTAEVCLSNFVGYSQ